MHIPCQQPAALPPHRLIDHFGRLGLAENIQFVRRHIRFAVCQIMFIPATAAQTTTLREWNALATCHRIAATTGLSRSRRATMTCPCSRRRCQCCCVSIFHSPLLKLPLGGLEWAGPVDPTNVKSLIDYSQHWLLLLIFCLRGVWAKGGGGLVIVWLDYTHSWAGAAAASREGCEREPFYGCLVRRWRRKSIKIHFGFYSGQL